MTDITLNAQMFDCLQDIILKFMRFVRLMYCFDVFWYFSCHQYFINDLPSSPTKEIRTRLLFKCLLSQRTTDFIIFEMTKVIPREIPKEPWYFITGLRAIMHSFLLI